MTNTPFRCRMHSPEVLARPLWGVGEIVITTKMLRAGTHVLGVGQVGYVVEVIIDGGAPCPHDPVLVVELLDRSEGVVREPWWPEVLQRWPAPSAT